MKLVIFDVDGTLVDSQHHILAAQATAFAALGLAKPARRASLSVVGLSLHEAFAALVGADGPVERLVLAYKEAWTALRGEAGFREMLYPGAASLLSALHDDPAVTLGIATGKSRPGVERLITSQGWRGLFATIQTADDHPSKPHPAMIQTALRETGCATSEAVMIGDTSYDMAMAVAAGVRAIGVAWGYHEPDALRAAGAEQVVATFDALRAVLEREGRTSL